MSSQPLLLSLTEAAALLSLTKQQLYEGKAPTLRGRVLRSRLRQAIPLPYVRLGKRLCFRRESLERWLAELEAASEVCGNEKQYRNEKPH